MARVRIGILVRMLLRDYRGFFRSLPYIGTRFECPICGWRFRKMLSAGIVQRKNARCPRCSSLERHRAIWLYLQRNTPFFDSRHNAVLHVAPEYCFKRQLYRIRFSRYTGIDLSYGLAEQKGDLTNLQLEDNSFDWFLCMHVLEHIPNDFSALRQLRRILKPSGKGILQAPIDESLPRTREFAHVTTSDERLKLYGQEDHVRLYGLDFKERLESAGFIATRVDFWDVLSETERKRYCVSRGEPFFLVKPSNKS